MKRGLDKLANAFNLNLEKLKSEYFGDQFAKKCMLIIAHLKHLLLQKKSKLLKSINVKQSEIDF